MKNREQKPSLEPDRSGRTAPKTSRDLSLGEPRLQHALRSDLRGHWIRNTNAMASHPKAVLRTLHEHASEITAPLVLACVHQSSISGPVWSDCESCDGTDRDGCAGDEPQPRCGTPTGGGRAVRGTSEGASHLYYSHLLSGIRTSARLLRRALFNGQSAGTLAIAQGVPRHGPVKR